MSDGREKLNNHQLKAGGLKLRTESPDTRRLNDASGKVLTYQIDGAEKKYNQVCVFGQNYFSYANPQIETGHGF